MKCVRGGIVCLIVLAVVSFAGGCSSDSNVRAAETVAGAMIATEIIDEIATWIRPLPQDPARPVDVSHTKVIFTNATNRAVRISLEGPRTYEVNVGHGGEINLVVVPGSYTSRISAPSVKTTVKSYHFEGGRAYEYHVDIEGRHEPR